MTLTIEIPDEVAEYARAIGLQAKDMNRFAIAGIAAGIAEAPAAQPMPWDAFFAAMVEGIEPDRPPLSDFAVSREGI